MSTILVTGSSGFIGMHLCSRLLTLGHEVVGVDAYSGHGDGDIRTQRGYNLQEHPRIDHFYPHRLNIRDYSFHSPLLRLNPFHRDSMDSVDTVVHLAAQVGVRESGNRPIAFAEDNLYGFACVLEACRNNSVGHIVYASSSSVYGLNAFPPHSVHEPVDHPMSLYAATKRANELMAHSYSWIFKLPTTGLRFFTVYGPYGRQDMAIPLFTESIRREVPIKLFGNGNYKRDFTYVSDVVDAIVGYVDTPPSGQTFGGQGDPANSCAPFRVVNVGSGISIHLGDLFHLIETHVGQLARIEYLPEHRGDPRFTQADISDAANEIGYLPKVSIEQGIQEYVRWHLDFYTDKRPFPLLPSQ